MVQQLCAKGNGGPEQSMQPLLSHGEERLSVNTSNLECEFNQNNNAKNVMGRVPDKINFIIKMGPLATNNLAKMHTFQESIAVGFYNQVTIYGV